MKKLCVFTGSADGNDPALRDVAGMIGGMVARRNIGIVFGAGNVGLMGAMAEGALAAGGKVTGVIPRFLLNREVPHEHLTELIVTESMSERKGIMYGQGDAFMVLPGGLGTMEEMFEVISHRYLNLHQRPICIFNRDGFWQKIIDAIDDVKAAGFVRDHAAPLFEIADDEDALARFLDKLRDNV